MCAFFLGKEKAMEKQFKKGDLQILDIIDLTNEGLGVGKKDNFTIFVDGGLPGDVAKVKLTEVKKNFAKGEAIQIIEPSKDRIRNLTIGLN
jgi:23S rRNA (uracil1939-C5)-methyltransferase